MSKYEFHSYENRLGERTPEEHAQFETDLKRIHDAYIARAINDLFPGLGWVVLMFDFGDKSRLNYLSNAQRKEMIAAMKELVAKMEADRSL